MKNLLVCLIILLAVLNAPAQEIENALLWKIEGKGIETSYIYGTMHALCDATLNEQVEEALYSTQVVVLEIDMDSPTLQADMMQSMMLPKEESISKYLNDEDAIILDEFLATHTSMKLAKVNNMAPLMIESLLIPATLDCPIQSIEINLMAHAKAEQEEVLGLETVEDQMNVFNEIPLKEQVTALVKKAKEGIENEKVLLIKMQEKYANQDVTGLMHLMYEDAGEFMENSEVILEKRNRNWIPRMLEISADRSAFYGVGAAHLAGANGVVNLLRQQGYEVTPIF